MVFFSQLFAVLTVNLTQITTRGQCIVGLFV